MEIDSIIAEFYDIEENKIIEKKERLKKFSESVLLELASKNIVWCNDHVCWIKEFYIMKQGNMIIHPVGFANYRKIGNYFPAYEHYIYNFKKHRIGDYLPQNYIHEKLKN